MVGRRNALVGRQAVRCTLVLEDGGRSRVVGETAQATAAESHVEPVVPDGLVGIDDDIVALAHAQQQAVDLVRLHGNQVRRDDGHGVVHQRQLEVVLHRGVDEAQTMLLALGERNRGILASPGSRVLGEPIEEHVVARGRAGTLCKQHDAVGRLVVIVHERERAKVDVVVGRGRSVDDDGPDDAVAVLRREMRVVPRGSVLGSPEAIHLAAAVGRDRALGHAVNAVMDIGVALVHAVPVDRGAVGLEPVDDGNLEIVAPVGLKGGADDLVVDHHDLVLLDTIRTNPVVGLGERERVLGRVSVLSFFTPVIWSHYFTYPSGIAGSRSSEFKVGVDVES